MNRKPLPAQSFGFMPTNRFWAQAFLTPLSVVFWLGVVVIFEPLASHFAWSWWVTGLAFVAFFYLWGGIIEWGARHIRDPRRTVPIELPAETRLGRVTFASAEFWDFSYARAFGHAAGFMQLVTTVLLFLGFFHPTWTMKLTTFALMVLASVLLGRQERAIAALQEHGG